MECSVALSEQHADRSPQRRITALRRAVVNNHQIGLLVAIHVRYRHPTDGIESASGIGLGFLECSVAPPQQHGDQARGTTIAAPDSGVCDCEVGLAIAVQIPDYSVRSEGGSCARAVRHRLLESS